MQALLEKHSQPLLCFDESRSSMYQCLEKRVGLSWTLRVDSGNRTDILLLKYYDIQVCHSDCGWTCGCAGKLRNPLRTRAVYLSASAVVIQYEEALYQLYVPLPFLALLIPYWQLVSSSSSVTRSSTVSTCTSCYWLLDACSIIQEFSSATCTSFLLVNWAQLFLDGFSRINRRSILSSLFLFLDEKNRISNCLTSPTSTELNQMVNLLVNHLRCKRPGPSVNLTLTELSRPVNQMVTG